MTPTRPREDAPGTSLGFAKYWIAIHQESLGVMEGALDRMRKLVAAGPASRRREAEVGDVALVAAEVVTTRERLSYWAGQVRELS